MTGKENSASKYLLQEQLFKKHFNLPNNEFTSFALDRQKNPNKYKIDKAKNLSKGENKNYHIVFDELGSLNDCIDSLAKDLELKDFKLTYIRGRKSMMEVVSAMKPQFIKSDIIEKIEMIKSYSNKILYYDESLENL